MRISRRLGLRSGEGIGPPSGDTTYTVSHWDTYRYPQSAASPGWRTVHDWKYTFGFQVDQNIFGMGDNYHNSMRIDIPAKKFIGKASKLTLKFSSLYVSSQTNHTFRWAVCSALNNSNYEGHSEVQDSNIQLAHGTFTPQYIDNRYHEYSFDFNVSVPRDAPFYIYIWAYNSSYGNCHVDGDVTITIS